LVLLQQTAQLFLGSIGPQNNCCKTFKYNDLKSIQSNAPIFIMMVITML